MLLYLQKAQRDSDVGGGSKQSEEPFIVTVLGAGRGPLVRATLNAADISNTNVKVC